MHLVLGSGPAGVSAARALLDRGLRVLMLDGGLTLEPERVEVVDRMARARPERWAPGDVALLRGGTAPQLGGVPLKFSYGSDFPYRDVQRWLAFENRGAAVRPTLARGGFSSVWGAVVAPYLAEDLADWPVDAEELAAHYRAVTRFLPVSGAADDLADELPLHTDSPGSLRPSAQARSLVTDLTRSRDRLRERGLRFGWSRLAVRAEGTAGASGCVQCGLCLHGCPHRLIYDSSQTLAGLEREPGFRYRGGVVVERLVETPDGVDVQCRSLASGEAERIRGERVYVGLGAAGTARLVLASLEAWDRPIEMRDSQYFLLPMLRFRGVPSPREEGLHTLCQAFLELRSPDVCERNVHLQVYGFNSLYVDLIQRWLGPLERLGRPAIDALLGRLLLIQGYLHSDVSPGIRATLHREGEGARLVLEGVPHPGTRPTLRRLVRHLARSWRELRMLPVPPLLEVAPPGRGFHFGGGFPMRATPGDLECDSLGRPRGLSRVHLVDSSVFPTIPSTTITFTVMANAHRIASAEP